MWSVLICQNISIHHFTEDFFTSIADFVVYLWVIVYTSLNSQEAFGTFEVSKCMCAIGIFLFGRKCWQPLWEFHVYHFSCHPNILFNSLWLYCIELTGSFLKLARIYLNIRQKFTSFVKNFDSLFLSGTHYLTHRIFPIHRKHFG